jgi:hypothetical protein
MKESELRSLIREVAKQELKESYGTDGEHSRAKLREAMKFAKMLHDFIREGDDLPEWVVEKISMSANHLNEVFQYLDTDWDRM